MQTSANGTRAAVIVPDDAAAGILTYILVRLMIAWVVVRLVYRFLQWLNHRREPKDGPELH